MSHDTIKAALDAPRLAEEAKARKDNKKSYNTDELVEALAANLAKSRSQRLQQVEDSFAALKKEWRPTGLIFPYELIEAYNITISDDYWFPVQNDPFPIGWKALPQQWPIPDNDMLIGLGYLHKCIKEHKYKPLSRPGKPKPWQNDYDWLYLTQKGDFWGAKTKEEAESAWLNTAKYIFSKRHEHACNLAKYRDACDALALALNPLRDDLYQGQIKAFFRDPNRGDTKPIKTEYWSADMSMDVFDFILHPKGGIPFMPRRFLIDESFGYHETGNEGLAGQVLFQAMTSQASKNSVNPTRENTQKGRGRKKGDGAYEDTQYLDEMKTLLDSGQAKSANEAAGIIANRTENKPSGQSTQAIQDRLARKYRSQGG